MKAIDFIFEWGGEARECCWSGIPYSIENHINSFLAINEICLKKTLKSIGIKSMIKIYNKLFEQNDFMLTETKLGEKQIDRLKLDADLPKLMFLEYVTNYIESSYIYQDLTVDFIYRMKLKNGKLSHFTPLPPNVSANIVKQRHYHTLEFYNRCKGIFTMSEWLASDLVKNTGISAKKVHFVGGGSNIDISKITDEQKTGNKFLFVGKDFERKNGPLVVDAFKIFYSAHPEAELYIAGPAMLDRSYMDFPNIYFLGRQSYQQLVSVYNKCDYYVMPSQFEAYGLVFAEALIYGLPCIGKNLFAMPEFIKNDENGYLIENDDKNELVNAMERIYMNKILVKNVRFNRMFYLDKYSWNSVAKRMVEVMEKDGF